MRSGIWLPKSEVRESGVGARKTLTPALSHGERSEEAATLRLGGTEEQRDADGSGDVDLGWWRGRLAEELADRPEGFSEGGELVVGQPHGMFVPGGRGEHLC